MKRKLFIFALITVCLSILAYGTIAYFSAENIAHNVITSGEIKIDLLEWADEEKSVPFPTTEVDGVMPGHKLTKIVELKNTGTNPAYIRIKVEKAIALLEMSGTIPDLDLIKLDYNTSDWTDGGNGFYYYNRALEAGDLTEPLFTTVSFDISMGNIYQKSKATISVKAYAVQVANQDVTNPWDAKGWPEG